ncbi:MAG: hypothetical protein PHX59_03610, partial [Sulfuricurvum sp.]|nr:hypothetical protein [Sulfuricurvum sp.]
MNLAVPIIAASLFVLSLYGAKIDEKIQHTTKQLSETKQTFSSLSAKLQATASKIVQQREVIDTQQQKISE